MFEGLGAVQESGQTNMLDYQAVRSIATRIGYPEAALWVMSTGTNTPRAYFAGLWRPSKEAPKGANRWLRCDGFECNRTLEKEARN